MARASVLATMRSGPGRPLRRFLPAQVRSALATYDATDAILAAELEPDSSCIDVGAYAGDVLAMMLRRAPLGRHVAYEPLPYMARRLRHRFPSVTVHEAAVSDVAGRAPFVHVRSRPTYSGLRARTYPGRETLSTFEVEVVTLDETIPADMSPRLIKIDVEGALLEVLRGGARLLERSRPVVIFEFGRLGDTYATTFEDVHDLFTGVGFEISDLSGRGPFDRATFAAITDRSDFVARDDRRY